MTMMRLVVGAGTASAADILDLTLAIAGDAARLGLKVRSVKSSHTPYSPSRYLTLIDSAKRAWLIRVSQHRRPTGTQHVVPHLDLVSLDGKAGRTETAAWLVTVANGTAPWFAGRPEPRKKGQRR